MEKNIRKIYKSILLIVIFLAAQGGAASDYPDYIGYVNDYAHLLSAPQASSLEQEIRNFDNRTTIELAVVTVNSIGSKNPQDYAIDLANYWGVGKRDKNNGIIFLVAMQSHDIWIEVGPGLSGQFSDSQVQRIVDNIIIPQFRANHPDLGIIEGVDSIINHFSGSSTSQNFPELISSPQDQDIGNPSFFKMAASFFMIVLTAFLAMFGIRGWSLAKKNSARIDDFEKLLNSLTDREASALEALKELKANYSPSIWKSAEEAYDLVDHERLELELLSAKRDSKRGFIFAGSSKAQIEELEKSFEKAQRNTDAPIIKLAETKKAQHDCATMLVGLDAAFLQAEKETTGGQISVATKMNLEATRHVFQEALFLAKQPTNAVDWIELSNMLANIRSDIEQISKDVQRDRAIAEQIQGQDPSQMLSQMKKTLDDAEKTLGPLGEAKEDLKAAKAEYDRAQEYQSGKINTIDLYLILGRIKVNIKHGHEHHKNAVERAVKEAEARATSVHHGGFGSSGSRSFGGGRSGGGSHGGGKW